MSPLVSHGLDWSVRYMASYRGLHLEPVRGKLVLKCLRVQGDTSATDAPYWTWVNRMINTSSSGLLHTWSGFATSHTCAREFGISGVDYESKNAAMSWPHFHCSVPLEPAV
jgi:hypothetical protein